jgi:outer membrane protein assembly factor BamB
VNTGQRAWKFEGSKLLPKGPSYTAIAIDDDRVLVSTDQTLFALKANTGQLLWQLSLPRQPLLRFDSPWTQFGRLQDRLFIRCYNGLFVLERPSGKLLWFFNCGQFGRPWPTVKNGRVYLAMRSPKSAFSKAKAVFSGKVHAIQAMDSEIGSFQTINIAVELDRVWKGPSESKVVIETTNTGFGYPFQVGQSYLFYCHRSPGSGPLSASRLSRTQPVEEARADLELLGAAVTTFNRD